MHIHILSMPTSNTCMHVTTLCTNDRICAMFLKKPVFQLRTRHFCWQGYLFRLDALVLSVIATATWLAGCPSQPVLYQND